MDKKSGRSGADGYLSLCATFNGAGLAVPLIPAPLAVGLREVDQWRWSTLDPDLQPDRHTDYMCEAEWLESPVPDHVTISHGGHGANSYALTLRMAWGPLALIVQDHWGGIYGDCALDAGRLAELFANVRRIVEHIDSDEHPSATDARARSLTLEVSPMRRLFRFRYWDPAFESWTPVTLPEQEMWKKISERVRSAESETPPSHTNPSPMCLVTRPAGPSQPMPRMHAIPTVVEELAHLGLPFAAVEAALGAHRVRQVRDTVGLGQAQLDESVGWAFHSPIPAGPGETWLVSAQVLGHEADTALHRLCALSGGIVNVEYHSMAGSQS